LITKQKFLIFALALLGFHSLDAQERRTVQVDGAILEYEMAGEGPAVVLLHGWANSLESWNFLFPVLAENYRVIRLNRRGYSTSTGNPDTSLDPLDLLVLLDSLGVEQAAIIGHSLGARSALRFVLEFPERVGALVSFGAPSPRGLGLPRIGPDRFPEGQAAIAREQGMAEWAALWDGHPILDGFIEGSTGQKILAAMLSDYDGRDLFNSQPPAAATPPAEVGRLSEINAPTLVITGNLEMTSFQIASDVVAYLIPDARRVVVEGGGHHVHLQQPDRFNSEILQFLDTVKW
jgi:3-oxoadipate enol-lactonase